MNDRIKLMGDVTIHTPDSYLHDWAYEEQCRREDMKDAYVSERLEELKAKMVALKAPDIFEQVMDNMDPKDMKTITRWLFEIWKCRNPFGEANPNNKMAVSIIADKLHDGLLRELDNEAKEFYE